MQANICILRGKAYCELDQRNQAKSQWLEAFTVDPKCYEVKKKNYFQKYKFLKLTIFCSFFYRIFFGNAKAYELLNKNHMLHAEENIALLNSLPFGEGSVSGGNESTNETEEIIENFYRISIAKFDKNPSKYFDNLEKKYPKISENEKYKIKKAECFFYFNSFEKSYKITKELIEEDKFNFEEETILIFISSLVELGLKNELFLFSHKLVDFLPNSELTWYSVGAYYFSCKNHDKARSYFNKSTNFNSNFVPAWLAFGHSFAVDDEHDQAMAAYRAAFRMVSGLLFVFIKFLYKCAFIDSFFSQEPHARFMHWNGTDSCQKFLPRPTI